jgi:hypothetical protein
MLLPDMGPHLYSCARKLECSWIGKVKVVPKPHCKEWDCHNNTAQFTNWYGGQRVVGYYWLYDPATDKLGAILHSVVRRDNGELLDITPFCDNRPVNVFSILKNQQPDYSQSEKWFSYE